MSRKPRFNQDHLTALSPVELAVLNDANNLAGQSIPHINHNALNNALYAVLDKHAPDDPDDLWAQDYAKQRLFVHEAMKAIFAWLEAR